MSRKIYILYNINKTKKIYWRLFIIIGLIAGIVGSLFSIFIRLELAYPGVQILHGDWQFYNIQITIYIFMAIFFMVMPTMIGGFGNCFVPLLILVSNMVFSRLNALDFLLLFNGKKVSRELGQSSFKDRTHPNPPPLSNNDGFLRSKDTLKLIKVDKNFVAHPHQYNQSQLTFAVNKRLISDNQYQQFISNNNYGLNTFQHHLLVDNANNALALSSLKKSQQVEKVQRIPYSDEEFKADIQYTALSHGQRDVLGFNNFEYVRVSNALVKVPNNYEPFLLSEEASKFTTKFPNASSNDLKADMNLLILYKTLYPYNVMGIREWCTTLNINYDEFFAGYKINNKDDYIKFTNQEALILDKFEQRFLKGNNINKINE